MPSHTQYVFFFFWTGYKRCLSFEDLYNLPSNIQSCNVVPKFLKNTVFFKQKKEDIRKNEVEMTVNGVGNVEFNKTSTSEEVKQRGVFGAFFKTFYADFFIAISLRIIHDILVFVPPFLLEQIIGYAKGEDQQLWKGIMYALGMLTASLFQSLLMAKCSIEMYMIGFKIQSSLTSYIYRKSLKISSQGKVDSTTGEVVNYMSVDVQRLVDMMVISKYIF